MFRYKEDIANVSSKTHQSILVWLAMVTLVLCGAVCLVSPAQAQAEEVFYGSVYSSIEWDDDFLQSMMKREICSTAVPK